ncbi:MAG: class F sortase [Chloroflexota bacterium]|nr:class F sortase [Chloroflexota bacterium]
MIRRVTFPSVLVAMLFSLTCASGYAGSKPQHGTKTQKGRLAQKHHPQKHAPLYVLPPGWPKLFSMPRFGVTATIEDISMRAAGDDHAPYRWNDVAWWDLGPKPGQQGMSNIYGHLDSTCCPAVFYHLRDLVPGDIVTVTYRNAKVLRFRVIWSHTYWNDEFPYGFVYGLNRHRSLALTTCTGVFHLDGSGYDHKVLVYARMIMPNGQLG